MRLIDANALQNTVKNMLNDHSDLRIEEALKKALKEIDNAPTIDAVPMATEVCARWRTWEEQFPDKTTRKKNNLGVFCSACQLHADNMTSYCPNCGAKMEVEHGE